MKSHWWVLPALTLAVAACRAKDLLSVPIPADVVDPGSIHTPAGAEALRAGAIDLFARAYQGAAGGQPPAQILWSGLLSDEFRAASVQRQALAADARSIDVNLTTGFDPTYRALQKTRGAAKEGIRALQRYAPSARPAEIGELYAIVGYAELFLAEDVCAGVPLSDVDDKGDITYGTSLTTDSLLTRALVDFDSAARFGRDSAQILALAHVGAGRTLLDLGRPADADAAVATVPDGFSYGTFFPPGAGASLYPAFSAYATVPNRKGGNGLDYRAAADPRVPLTMTGFTATGDSAFSPTEFPTTSSTDSVPLAKSVEARLIHAEAALAAGDPTTWLSTLNALRAGVSGLPPIVDPVAPTARIDTTFTERAFWLFGTGHRLADLRRLVRRYGRDPNTVFPTGPYDNGNAVSRHAQYGTDVNYPILKVEAGNPNFSGCLNRTA
jgi:hypothetical protein